MLLPCVCPTDQERLDTLYSDTVAAITAHVEGRQPDPSLLLAPTTTQPDTNTTTSSTPSTTPASSSHPTSSANPHQKGIILSGTSQAALAVVRDPTAYALQLSEVVTGEAVQMQGYGQVMDALVRLAPPAALTPQGVAEAHRQVWVWGQDLESGSRVRVEVRVGGWGNTGCCTPLLLRCCARGNVVWVCVRSGLQQVLHPRQHTWASHHLCHAAAAGA